jgi:hypothetical protein
MDLRYVKSAAYHEAGHTVVAAAQEMPLRHPGIHLDPDGSGISFYWFKKPGEVGTDLERERTIISAGAGWAAQIRFYPRCPEAGASDDVNLITELLNEMYSSGSQAWHAAEGRLYAESQRLVERHWSAIEALAVALWAKPWTPRTPDKEREWSKGRQEKWMDGTEVDSILQEFDIHTIIVDDSAGKYDAT